MTSLIERWNEGIARLRAQRDAVLAEREAERERQEAEQAARTIRPGPVDAAVDEQAKEQATPLIGLLRRFQDAQAKFESVRREVDHWMLSPIQTDDDLDRTIAVRNELESSSDLLTLDGKRKLKEKIAELTAAIADAKARGFYSMAEPLFKTYILFADSLFNQNRCHRVTEHNTKYFVLALKSLEDYDRQTGERITVLFDSCGVPLFPGAFGPSIVLEPKEILVGNGPLRSEFGAPDKPTIDGLEIVKDTRRATEWHAEREAERQREETARQEAERETAQRERKRKLAELRDFLNDPSIRDELLTAMKPAEVQPQPITENV